MSAIRTAITVPTVVAFWLALLTAGQAGWPDHAGWREPHVPTVQRLPGPVWWGNARSGTVAAAVSIEQQRSRYASSRNPRLAYELAERLVALAVEADEAAQPQATDLYFQAATFAWVALRDGAAGDAAWHRSCYVYHTSVARMLATAQQQGRIIPGEGLLIRAERSWLRIPFTLQGFAWRQEDFQELHPVGPYRSESLLRLYRRTGWGVPLVVRRARRTWLLPEEPFLAEESLFAATAVLRPDVEQVLGMATASAAVLELYNPLNVSVIASERGPLPLAADISAVFAFGETDQLPLLGPLDTLGPLDMFLRPDTGAGLEGLFFLEPYQPGKIPVVLVHGLLSSPRAWVNLTNDLRAVPGFQDHFQIWMFWYATGNPFLESAARMRAATRAALSAVDPSTRDPALQHKVLIGHSMGGLVSKLQVIPGGEPLWRAVADRPLHQIVADERSRSQLAAAFHFQPQSSVRRVVFIATPHGGSHWARSCIGRLGAGLVRRDPVETARHAALVAANPGVFSREFQARIPTSVDMLEPTSPLLRAIRAQKVRPGVAVHTIAGTGGIACGPEPGDGVVSLSSAWHPGRGVLSVPAAHTDVLHHPAASAEVARILAEHLVEVQAGGAERGEPDRRTDG